MAILTVYHLFAYWQCYSCIVTRLYGCMAVWQLLRHIAKWLHGCMAVWQLLMHIAKWLHGCMAIFVTYIDLKEKLALSKIQRHDGIVLKVFELFLVVGWVVAILFLTILLNWLVTIIRPLQCSHNY